MRSSWRVNVHTTALEAHAASYVVSTCYSYFLPGVRRAVGLVIPRAVECEESLRQSPSDGQPVEYQVCIEVDLEGKTSML